MNSILLNNIVFKTQSFRKNFDLILKNENIITECEGTISELRISERKLPLVIGEYGFSVWNISLAKLLNIDLIKLIKSHELENSYDELIKLIENNKFSIFNYDKIVIIHTLLIHPDYRKSEITEEFIECIYREYHSNNTAIIALVKPIQDNIIDSDFYFNHKTISIKNKIGNTNECNLIPTIEYYSLKDLMKNKDKELNEYKLFAVANRCGLQRIEDSYLFLFSPEKTVKRIKEKNNIKVKF